ncbi:ABC transporter permease [Yinghuangia sp. YIM S09857]|uniref:ABC transporter permease n=1 Tax=Yinghuangia sp. YIM S09857 TaxID=3436929 RepID=UPI003F53AC0A
MANLPTELVAPPAEAVEPPRRSAHGLRRVLAPIREAHGLARFMLWSGLVITGLFVVIAVFAPWIAPYGHDSYESGGERFPKQESPSGDHPFGTTVQNFDVLSRVVWGARTALEVMVYAVAFSLFVGVLLGLLSGYFGGWLDRVLVLVMDTLFAFPYLLLAIVAAFMFSDVPGGGIVTAALAITVVYIPQYFRVVRASTLSAREATYVEAARAMGAKPRTIIGKYVFSNVIQSVPVITTLNAADAIATLAGLGFLGFGIQPTEAAEWGYDLQRAIPDLGADMWWTATFPGIAIVLAILGFTLVGEGLNDVMNPSMRKRRIRPVVIPPITRPRKEVVLETEAEVSEATEESADEEVPEAAEADEAAETEEETK